ncbi:DNA-binding transcriptional regulator, LysR family [Desulfonatronum thiosulfatophilum]|uniref:DNA-binding transcriptional regulator, LysR family n=2 Tax=Desulfonatronum thiosulfatophilum TaxID=617002 RepID=A0A1G6BN05_9BACT|nr:DNA-binding transcriptional regulator, LysR family [Desulfonatronum thiosulfatophilum]
MEVSFFDRLGRGIQPTQAADVLYRHCKTIFDALDQAETEIRLLSNKVSGELVLGGSTIPANYLIPSLLNSFLLRYPDVSISLIQGDSREIVNQILLGNISIGIVGARENVPELEFVALFDDSLIVLAAPDFLRAYAPPFTLDCITRMPWIVRQPGSGTQLATESALQAAGFSPRMLRVLSVVDSTEALLRFVRCGLGIAVSSKLAARDYIQRGELVALDVPELQFHRSFYVVHNPQRHQFPVIRFFLNYLIDTVSQPASLPVK